MNKTYDDIINNLILTNLKEFPDNHVGVVYKNFEIDTPNTYGKTNEEICREIKEQIYVTEEIDFPKMTRGEIDIIQNRVYGIKNCIGVNRAHVNEAASTMGEKALLLEKLSYNIETKVDALLVELEDMLDRLEVHHLYADKELIEEISKDSSIGEISEIFLKFLCHLGYDVKRMQAMFKAVNL